jgi:hypothetical protein
VDILLMIQEQKIIYYNKINLNIGLLYFLHLSVYNLQVRVGILVKLAKIMVFISISISSQYNSETIDLYFQSIKLVKYE